MFVYYKKPFIHEVYILALIHKSIETYKKKSLRINSN